MSLVALLAYYLIKIVRYPNQKLIEAKQKLSSFRSRLCIVAMIIILALARLNRESIGRRGKKYLLGLNLCAMKCFS